MLISIIIPCYNSSNTLCDVISEISETFKARDDIFYEIILINDCSKDSTWEVISQISAQNSSVYGIDLGKNFGQHAAIMAGLNNCLGDIIVCMDDDGQTPANEIFTLIDALDDSTDAVYAKYSKKEHGFFRNLGSKVNDIMALYLINKPKELYLSSYFAVKRYVVDSMLEYKNPYPYVIGLVLQSTNKIKNVSITHRERKAGESGYSIKKLISLWVNGFTSFSVKPLRIATALGFTLAIFGFLYACFTVARKAMEPSIPMGWSSLMSALLLTNGVILIVLGLVGEYIGRIFLSLNNIPQFVIRERTKKNGKDDDHE